MQAEWLCLNCQTQRALAGQLGDMGKVSIKAEPTVAPKTEISKPPGPAPKPSPEKHAEELQTATTDVETIVTTSVTPASVTNDACTVTYESGASASIDDDKVKMDRALKDMLGTAIDERDLTAPIPAVESQRSVITSAEALKASDKAQPESVLMQHAVTDVGEVEHHIQMIELFFVVVYYVVLNYVFISGERGYRHSYSCHRRTKGQCCDSNGHQSS